MMIGRMARGLFCAILMLFSGRLNARGANPTAPAGIRTFLQQHCFECHDSDMKKGGLDLSALEFDLKNPQSFAHWAKVEDRVSLGEMPPKKKPRPALKELKAFTNSLTGLLLAADENRISTEGRATQRRLNRFEYEDTLRDLLCLPSLEVKSFLPEDSESHGFDKAGDALDVSHVQMARYLSAAEFALREAMAPQATRPVTTTNRYYTWDQGSFFGAIKLAGPVNRRTFPLVGYELQRDMMKAEEPQRGDPDLERKEKEALAVVVSTYEPTEIRFNSFRAPVSGKYRLRLRAYSVWLGHNYTNAVPGRRSEPITLYADTPPRLLRKLGSFDVDPEPMTREMVVDLLAGETIRPDAARFFRSRPPDFKNPLETSEGSPAVAFSWLEVEGPLIDQWPPASHRILFGDLPITNHAVSATSEVVQAPRADSPPRRRRNRKRFVPPAGVEVVSAHPQPDAEKLLRTFMQRMYRGPVKETEVLRFLNVITNAIASEHTFTESMIAGYTAVLSSPGFLYFNEKPGRLGDLAVAERLSYFIWNSCPDQELRRVAERGELHLPKVLRDQTERLLNDPRSRRFVDDFLNYWLDLRLIEGTAPDAELYPDYQLDDLLVESMIGESQLFFKDLIARNLGVTNLVASDFTYLNERLATHYGIPGVDGVTLRRVTLPGESVRGGLLTEASVLKVTANGTTTSPVKRGVWIMTRLIGKPPPPPPPSVPALEPDTRGATTIREQLAKHRSQETCAACHRNIDPPGFALEAFDVMGGARSRYRVIGSGEPVKGSGHNGLIFHFGNGPAVDPSGELADGEKFQDVRELKSLLLKNDEQLARNLIQQLLVYSTGAPVQFSDRPQIANILARTRKSGYPVRGIIHEIVQSDMFLNK
jgi:uncharacterized protein DUF1592/uncharacterized protein DUF1588/uncharacterized protein DUF1585/uncharacterized protein DUF1587/uncharacterized protein DUF1595/cytochrome c